MPEEHTRSNDGAERLYKATEVVIFSLAMVFVLFGAYARSFGDTANSRLATVYSITKHGTFYIDPVNGTPNRFERTTIDKVIYNGHLLSSKPPMLPLLMTAEYIVLHTLFGLDLEDPKNTDQIIKYMTMVLVGIPYLLTLYCFSGIARWFFPDPAARLLMLVGLAFGTQLWGYSTNLNNHVPGAATLTVALYYGLGLGTGALAPTAWRFVLFGLTAGLTPTLDMPITIFVAPVGLWVLWKYPRQTLGWTVAAAAAPLAIQSAVLYNYTESPFPVQTNKNLYLYETSFWRNPIGIDCLNEPKGTYLFHMTLGRCGLFSLFPILATGIVAAIRSIFRRETKNRIYLIVGAACFFVLTSYYVVKTNNYGGEAYGFRWYIGAMPVLLLMGGEVISSVCARIKSGSSGYAWQCVFLGVMLGISFYSAWECTVTPWAANHTWPCRFLGPSY